MSSEEPRDEPHAKRGGGNGARSTRRCLSSRRGFVCFDTIVLDLIDELADPVAALFGVELYGGTDINQAVAYCAGEIERPGKAHFVLTANLFEGASRKK